MAWNYGVTRDKHTAGIWLICGYFNGKSQGHTLWIKVSFSPINCGIQVQAQERVRSDLLLLSHRVNAAFESRAFRFAFSHFISDRFSRSIWDRILHETNSFRSKRCDSPTLTTQFSRFNKRQILQFYLGRDSPAT